jgi:type II secretory pathway pseudopilin PulG
MRRLIRGQKGIALLELLIALLLLGVIGGGLLLGVSTAYKAAATSDELATAESLARSVMETVKNSAYAGSYTPVVPADYTSAGYTATISAVPVAGKLGIQKITVDIFHRGDFVMSLEGYKSSR